MISQEGRNKMDKVIVGHSIEFNFYHKRDKVYLFVEFMCRSNIIVFV